jgi:hypothetical protein
VAQLGQFGARRFNLNPVDPKGIRAQILPTYRQCNHESNPETARQQGRHTAFKLVSIAA